MLGVDKPGNRMDASDFERRLLLERRQDARQATRQHGLADAGRSPEQHVVTARGGQFQRTARAFLPADVGEVERHAPALPVSRHEFGRVALAAQVRDRLGEVAHTDRVDAGEHGLRARVVGADDSLEPGASRSLGHAEHAADPS